MKRHLTVLASWSEDTRITSGTMACEEQRYPRPAHTIQTYPNIPNIPKLPDMSRLQPFCFASMCDLSEDLVKQGAEEPSTDVPCVALLNFLNGSIVAVTITSAIDALERWSIVYFNDIFIAVRFTS